LRRTLVGAATALLFSWILPLANAVPISPGAFGSGAVVESFEGLSAGPNIPLVDPSFGFFNPATVGPFTFGSGVTFTNPVPNPPLGNGVVIGDFSLGIATFGLTTGGVITSAANVPFGSAFMGLNSNAPGPIEFTFASDMLNVGGYVSGLPGGVVTLTAYDAGNNLLESTTVATVPVGSWPTNFIGLQRSEGIRRIELNASTLVLDGLTFEAIPEPSTLTLAGLGLFGLLAYGWRRRQAA